MDLDSLYDMLLDSGDGDSFDRHIFACAIVSGWDETEMDLVDHLGLSLRDLKLLFGRYFSGATALLDIQPPGRGRDDSIEEPDLRRLLFDNRTPGEDETLARWLARIIARRSLGPNHLWQDLGLPSRDDLNRLMDRHFAPMAQRNVGMRWKKFFYRLLCESEGVMICKSPTCESCDDYHACFAIEDGEPLPFFGKPRQAEADQFDQVVAP